MRELILGASALAGVFVVGCSGHVKPEPRAPKDNTVVVVGAEHYPDIVWIDSAEEARGRAADEHKPLLVFIRAAWSQPSVVMDQTVWRDARVLRQIDRFVPLRIDLTDSYSVIPKEIKETYGVENLPTTILIASDGTVGGRWGAGAAHAGDIAAAMATTK